MRLCAPVYVVAVELCIGANHVSNDSKRVSQYSVVHVTLEISCTKEKVMEFKCRETPGHRRNSITNTHPTKAATPLVCLEKLCVVTLRM